MKRTRKIKRHFLLLELMVAAFILLVCIAPAMRIFTTIYLSEQEMIRENQRDHLAHRLHANITEGLYKRQYRLEGGTKESSTFLSISDTDTETLLKKYEYEYEARIVILKAHKPKNEILPDKYLAQLIIKLKDISFNAQSQKKKKEDENGDLKETSYNYIIYIDAGAWEKVDHEKKVKDDGADSTEEDHDHEVTTDVFRGHANHPKTQSPTPPQPRSRIQGK